MPDRDIVRGRAARGWGTACSLFANDGATNPSVTAIAKALAREFRKEPPAGLNADAFERKAQEVLERRLFAPVRFRFAESIGVDGCLRREAEVRVAIRADVEHMRRQTIRAKRLTIKPRRRLSPAETASLEIRTLPAR